LHEAGHALYEQGVDPALEGTSLENVVGRGRSFWQHFYPLLQSAFPEQLSTLETFYRAINRVERSLIRTDADEVTYNLHIMLRFELELELLEGRLRVKDLSEAWRTGMQAYLGLFRPTIEMVAYRTSIGMPAASVVDFRATLSATFSARSSTLPLSRHIPISRVSSQ
jgi:carboxypeptidase Taq